MTKPQKTLADALNEVIEQDIKQIKPELIKPIKNQDTDELSKSEVTTTRTGKKHLGGYIDLATWQQWNILRIEQDGCTTQAMLEEAINDLFIKYGKSSIA